MTISALTNAATFPGDGVTTVFTFAFVWGDPSYLQATYVSSAGVQTVLDPSLFTLSLNPAAAGQLWGIGGTITYPLVGSPIPIGSFLSLQRVVPEAQTVSLANQGSATPSSMERGLDLLEMQIQQATEVSDHAITVPISDPIPLPLPAVAQRAGLIMAFDSMGNPIAASAAGAGLISSAMAPVVDAATLALGRTAFGLGSTAVENIGSGLQGDGAGNLRTDRPLVSDSTNQTVTAAFHETYRVATGPVTYALPRANTLWSGFGFFIHTISGQVQFDPNAADAFLGYALNANFFVPPNSLVYVTTDAAAAGTWYATPIGWTNPNIALSGTTTIGNQHNHATLSIGGGAFYTVTFPSGSTLDPNFQCTIISTETTVGHGIAGLGQSFTLYPGESFDVFNDAGTLRLKGAQFTGSGTGSPPPRRWRTANVNVFVDTANGSDDPTVADGLAAGARAFKTIKQAFRAMYQNFDHSGSQPTINIANGTYNESIQQGGQPVGTGVFFINGASALGVIWQPANSGTPYCFNPGDGLVCEYSNIQWNGGGISSVAVQCHQTCIIDQNAGVGFGSMGTGNHVSADGAGITYNVNSSYAVNGSGGATNHLSMPAVGIINLAGGITVTITNSPNITNWLNATSGSISLGAGITWTGSILTGGKKWGSAQGATIFLGGNATNVPGSVAGSPATGSAPTGSTGWATA